MLCNVLYYVQMIVGGFMEMLNLKESALNNLLINDSFRYIKLLE